MGNRFSYWKSFLVCVARGDQSTFAAARRSRDKQTKVSYRVRNVCGCNGVEQRTQTPSSDANKTYSSVFLCRNEPSLSFWSLSFCCYHSTLHVCLKNENLSKTWSSTKDVNGVFYFQCIVGGVESIFYKNNNNVHFPCGELAILTTASIAIDTYEIIKRF